MKNSFQSLLGLSGALLLLSSQAAFADVGCQARALTFYNDLPLHHVHLEAQISVKPDGVSQEILSFQVSAKDVTPEESDFQLIEVTVVGPDGKTTQARSPIYLPGASALIITVPASEKAERTQLSIECAEGLGDTVSRPTP